MLDYSLYGVVLCLPLLQVTCWVVRLWFSHCKLKVFLICQSPKNQHLQRGALVQNAILEQTLCRPVSQLMKVQFLVQ